MIERQREREREKREREREERKFFMQIFASAESQ